MSYDNWKLDNGDRTNIESAELDEIIEFIEGDNSLTVACNTAENLTGFTFEPDSLSLRVDHGELMVSTSIGVEFDVCPEDPQGDARRQLAFGLRRLADQLDRHQELPQQSRDLDLVPTDRRFERLVFFASAFACVAITLAAWKGWM